MQSSQSLGADYQRDYFAPLQTLAAKKERKKTLSVRVLLFKIENFNILPLRAKMFLCLILSCFFSPHLLEKPDHAIFFFNSQSLKNKKVMSSLAGNVLEAVSSSYRLLNIIKCHLTESFHCTFGTAE